LKAIITSIITSLFVSLITFVLGLRAGKNQSDRPILKEQYRKLSIHFEKLLAGLEEGIPVRWHNFELIHYANRSEYTPLVKNMKKDGTIIDINYKLAKQLEELEIKLLNWGEQYFQFDFRIKEEAVRLLKEMCKEQIIENKNDISTKINRTGFPYSSILYGEILIQDKLKKLKERFKNNTNLGLCLDLNNKGSHHWVYIFPNDLKESNVIDYLERLHKISINISGVSKSLSDRDKLREQTNRIVKKVHRRTRDPHTFWETFGKALIDVFRA
jgi:hypothetical protein